METQVKVISNLRPLSFVRTFANIKFCSLGETLFSVPLVSPYPNKHHDLNACAAHSRWNSKMDWLWCSIGIVLCNHTHLLPCSRHIYLHTCLSQLLVYLLHCNLMWSYLTHHHHYPRPLYPDDNQFEALSAILIVSSPRSIRDSITSKRKVFAFKCTALGTEEWTNKIAHSSCL